MKRKSTGDDTGVLVVAGAICGPDGRVLLQQRLPGKRHAGLWEFPGGKVEEGESPERALAREIEEELAIAISELGLERLALAGEPASATQPGIVLILYNVPAWSGNPRGVDGQDWGWFSVEEAAALPLAPMDRELLASLPSGGSAAAV